jgi:outer membrane usher protein
MLEVYRNGILISRQEVAPGQFNLNNIPGQVGQGNTQVIIRDAFGNSRQINSPYYLSPQLLEKGLSDYSYGIGFQRNNLADSWQYGEPALTAFHRIGLSDWLTLGGRLEGTRDSISAGSTLSLGVLVGEIDSAFALSRSPGGSGAAGSLAYQYTTRSLGGGASVQWMSSEYWTLGLKPSQDRPVIQGLASFSVNLGFQSTLTTQYSYQRFRDAGSGTQHQISVTVDTRLNPKLTLIATAAAALPGSSNGNANQVFVGLSYFFGHNIVGTISADHSGGRLSSGNQGTVSLQKPLPVGNGIGFLLQSAEGSQQQQNAIFQYQNDYGRYEADYTRTAGVSSSTLTAAGGFSIIGGRVIPTRPIQDGYALVRVPGLAGIPAQWSNQAMGTTDRHGDLLIPNLLPYYGNQLSITESAVPLNYVVDSDRVTIAVPYRGGALVEFPVHKIQQVTGTLRLRDGDLLSIPFSGQLSVTSYAAEKVSPLGRRGEFYFENLPPGHYEASIDSKTGTCKFEIEVPKSDLPLLRLPMQYCDNSILSSAPQ